jgi:hypothetical protein
VAKLAAQFYTIREFTQTAEGFAASMEKIRAIGPPSDGYQPSEDPLVGVARQIEVTASLKQHRPDLTFVGSACSHLQEWLPHVAQHVVRTGWADLVGLGHMYDEHREGRYGDV